MSYQYTWIAGRHGSIAGENVPWLREAARERGIKVTGKTREQLINDLMRWEQEN